VGGLTIAEETDTVPGTVFYPGICSGIIIAGIRRWWCNNDLVLPDYLKIDHSNGDLSLGHLSSYIGAHN